MHTDARTLDEGSLLEGDICIIGAGAAGITQALQWIDTPHKVLLLEGGGMNVEAQMQDLYAGEVTGLRYFPLQSARLHYFGGTTGHWSGLSAPLDPIDFKKRDWIPYSGWPVTREELDPYYARATELVELPSPTFDAAYWQKQDPDLVELPLDETMFWTKVWQFSPPTRFGTVYRDQVVNAPNVHLYTYANVMEIEANEGVSAVEGLRIKTIDGKEHRVRARYYVTACGAIQNARVLLASNSRMPKGLGNQNDVVGRYFMEHVEMTAGHLMLAQPEPMKLYLSRPKAEISLTETAQEKHGILNGTISLQPGAMDATLRSRFDTFSPDAEANVRAREARDARSRVNRASGAPAPTPSPQQEFRLFRRGEQAPNPASRVMLSDEKDALGMPRTKFHWQLSEIDKRTIRVELQVFGEEMGRMGLGRVQLLDWLLDGDDRAWPDHLSGGWHHMGTTRMSDDPKTGVVDGNCKVHGLDNLYVAGSSTYATGGAANPTLTIVTLSLRLADHLKKRVA